MKKIFIFIVVLFFIVSYAKAADENGDCNIVFSREKLLANWGNDDEDFVAKMMPKTAMEKAFDNLKSYCCDVKKISSGSCTSANSDVFYPESIYLFDHIFDIYLRRLDAKQENENGNDLLYGLEPDEKGKKWRDFMLQHGNDINGSLPLEIKTQYDSVWSTTQTVQEYQEKNGVEQYGWKEDIVSAINDYETWTLFDKYNLACDVSQYITELMNSKKLTTQEYERCTNLIKIRIDNEDTYTKVILMQKGEKMLVSNLNAYLGTYFVNNKLSELLQTVVNMSTAFSEVNKAITKLIEQCS